MKNNIAIIAARGGSKGIKDKNIKNFCGKPLIAWSILQAHESTSLHSVWVTSDSDEILDIAAEYEAKTIKRPESLATDCATSESAWEHALQVVQREIEIDACVALQATSPLREPNDISKALQVFYDNSFDSLFSAALLEDFLIWRKIDGALSSLNYNYKKRGMRQEREPEYVENGSLYIFTPEILKRNNRLGGRIGMYQMDFWKSFEIDSLNDWELCSTLFTHYNLQKYFSSYVINETA